MTSAQRLGLVPRGAALRSGPAGLACGVLGVVAGVLAGCATPTLPPATVPAPPSVVLPPPDGPGQRAAGQQADFERRRAAEASLAETQGRWADAALGWELLAIARPQDGEVARRLAQSRARMASVSAEHLARGLAAQRRGELDGAAQALLQALSVAPGNAEAADALRLVERERNRRSFVGKFTRNTLTRRAASDAEMKLDDTRAPRGGAPMPPQAEHAALLVSQGDTEGAIALLREAMKDQPREAGYRVLLVDLHVQRAESLLGSDPRAAKAQAEQALAIDPRHAAALAVQRKAQAALSRNAPNTSTASPPSRPPPR
jgi:tetratricopeptide (TPR) repeat protein